MTTYYITFGQKHLREPHPTLGMRPELVDGYLTIEDETELAARIWLNEHLKNVYSSLYEEVPEGEFFPLGNLGDVKEAVATQSEKADAIAAAYKDTPIMDSSLEYKKHMDWVISLGHVLGNEPLQAMLNTVRRADSLGPVIFPTEWVKGHEKLPAQTKVLEAAIAYAGAVRELREEAETRGWIL